MRTCKTYVAAAINTWTLGIWLVKATSPMAKMMVKLPIHRSFCWLVSAHEVVRTLIAAVGSKQATTVAIKEVTLYITLLIALADMGVMLSLGSYELQTVPESGPHLRCGETNH